MPDRTSKRVFDSEPPTNKATFDPEAYARESEKKLTASAKRADMRTLKRGIVPTRAASDVDVEWMSLDAEAQRFMALVDGERSVSKIFHELGISLETGFELLERLLVAGAITLRH